MPNRARPTDEEILTMPKVTILTASEYLDMDPQLLRLSLEQQRAPFGFAVKGVGGKWSFYISPGMLVAYKRGELPFALPPTAGER